MKLYSTTDVTNIIKKCCNTADYTMQNLTIFCYVTFKQKIKNCLSKLAMNWFCSINQVMYRIILSLSCIMSNIVDIFLLIFGLQLVMHERVMYVTLPCLQYYTFYIMQRNRTITLPVPTFFLRLCYTLYKILKNSYFEWDYW